MQVIELMNSWLEYMDPELKFFRFYMDNKGNIKKAKFKIKGDEGSWIDID